MLEASKNLTARTPSKEEQYSQLSWLLVVVGEFQRAKHQLSPSIIMGSLLLEHPIVPVNTNR
jgi:protein involved in temperature-dependent protein secretion